MRLAGTLLKAVVFSHREDCEQFKDLAEAHPERVIDVRWGDTHKGGYAITLRIEALDRNGLLRDITTLLANEKISVSSMNSNSSSADQTAVIKLGIEIVNIDTVSRVIARIGQVEGVLEARRL